MKNSSTASHRPAFLTLAGLLAGLGLLLSACSSPEPSAPASTLTVPPASTASTGTLAPTLPVRGCSVSSPEPTLEPVSLVPAVTEVDFTVGPAESVVSMVEYCDFQAPICRSMAAVVSNLIHDHPKDIRFTFRPVPLVGRLDKTELAVQAALSAGDQDHFWEMYDLLFQRSEEWDSLTPADFKVWLKDHSLGLGLDPDRFASDLESQATLERTQALYAAGQSFGLQSVPLLLINGQPQPTFALGYDTLNSNISLLVLAKRQFTECPPFSIDPSKRYIATLHTEKGEVLIELFPGQAPLAVNSFVYLAQHGWFDDITFHRVIPGSLVQTGDPSGTGRGNPGYFFADEINPDLKFDAPGLVGMANQGPGTNGSQFFITLAAAPQFNGGYTIFGRVLDGLDTLKKLTPRDPQEDPRLPPGDRLLSVEVMVE